MSIKLEYDTIAPSSQGNWTQGVQSIL